MVVWRRPLSKGRLILIFIDCILLIASFCFCAIKFYEYHSDRASYGKIQQKSADPLQGLLAINPETVGWISIENTHINYPVARHNDNEFYLTNDFERKRSEAGCIYMDYRNKASEKDMNTILYGHHMKDLSMFRDLVLFKNKDFFYNNGRIVFNTLDKKYEWQVFSVYVAYTDFDYLMTSFKDKKAYAGYIKAIKDRSLFSSEIAVNTDDRILTLSTCSYESANARTVVHAKMVSEK
jgi:sortase B